MEWIFLPEAWIALATLTLLEIVLGIDNIIFISILVGRLPESQRRSGRLVGLGLAMVTRILLLLCLTWVMGLTADLFTVLGEGISGRDLILLGGGLFLLAKSSLEIHHSLEGASGDANAAAGAGYFSIIAQIAVIDIVFSLDSVITAVGLAEHVGVMVTAIVISVAVMMAASGAISDFVDRHPSIKMLALSFLIMIGAMLVGESLDLHVPKGYIYFAMAFSVTVEMLNIRMRRKSKVLPVHLRKSLTADSTQS